MAIVFNLLNKKKMSEKKGGGGLFWFFVILVIIIIILLSSPSPQPSPTPITPPILLPMPSPPSPPSPPFLPSSSNYDPNASFSCDISDCSAYAGSTDPILNLINDSSDPNGEDDIVKSRWDILNHSGDEVEFDDLCKYSIQSRLLQEGEYVVELTITDKAGGSDSAMGIVKIRRDIVSDFECSLSEDGPWSDCEINFKGIQKEYAYFKDVSILSEGAIGISSWMWKINNVPFFSGTGSIPISSENIANRLSTVELTITDNKGRTDSTSYTFKAKLPLPTWQEVGS